MKYSKILFCISMCSITVLSSCKSDSTSNDMNTTEVTPDTNAQEEMVINQTDSTDQLQTVESNLDELISSPEIKQGSAEKTNGQKISDNSPTTTTVSNPIIQTEATILAETEIKFSHEQWDLLLRKNVAPSGKVNYKSFVADKILLLEYLALLEKNPPTNEWTRKEKLAFWINAYNAFTIKTIVDHFPVKSIMDIDKPWDQKNCKIGDKFYSLSQIENDILRKMNEPRIHFAINCASVSCPKLLNRAFNADNLESQLKEATLSFINDPTKNVIAADQIKISKIFEWYAADFSDGNIIEFLNIYKAEIIQANAKISFLEYDWNLND